jgi:hypothetical protein
MVIEVLTLCWNAGYASLLYNLEDLWSWFHVCRQSCWSLSWNSWTRKEHRPSSGHYQRFSWTHLYKRQDRFGYKVVLGLIEFWDCRLLLWNFCDPCGLFIVDFLFDLLFYRKLPRFSPMLEQLPFSSISGQMHSSSVPGTVHLECWLHSELMQFVVAHDFPFWKQEEFIF